MDGEKKLEFGHVEYPYEQRIDNGASPVRLRVERLARNLEFCGLEQASILKIVNAIAEFSAAVSRDRARGMHLGSTNPETTLMGEILKNDPSYYGLQTQTELRLIAKLIEASCINENDIKELAGNL